MIVKRRQKRIRIPALPTTTWAGASGNVWAVNFQLRSIVAGERLKILSIVDEHIREALRGQVGHSITDGGLTGGLDVLTTERGSPRALRRDNEPEFISTALRSWARAADLMLITPGQPWRNRFIESINGDFETNGSVLTSFTIPTMLLASSGYGRLGETRSGNIHHWDNWLQRFVPNDAPTRYQ